MFNQLFYGSNKCKREEYLNHLQDELEFIELRIIEDQYKVKMLLDKIEYIKRQLDVDKLKLPEALDK